MDGIGTQERQRDPDECGKQGNEQAVLDRQQVVFARKQGREIGERNAACCRIPEAVDEDVG